MRARTGRIRGLGVVGRPEWRSPVGAVGGVGAPGCRPRAAAPRRMPRRTNLSAEGFTVPPVDGSLSGPQVASVAGRSARWRRALVYSRGSYRRLTWTAQRRGCLTAGLGRRRHDGDGQSGGGWRVLCIVDVGGRWRAAGRSGRRRRGGDEGEGEDDGGNGKRAKRRTARLNAHQ